MKTQSLKTLVMLGVSTFALQGMAAVPNSLTQKGAVSTKQSREADQAQRDMNRLLAKKNGSTPSRAVTEKGLYAELINASNAGNFVAFSSRYQAFIKRYPRSRFVDDVLYMKGMMALSNRDYGVALRQFNAVVKKYPKSNAAPMALFAKGVTLKRMNLDAEARKSLQAVIQKYPKAPQVARAQAELKLMK